MYNIFINYFQTLVQISNFLLHVKENAYEKNDFSLTIRPFLDFDIRNLKSTI